LRANNWRTREFNPAIAAAGLDIPGLTSHKLRHTAASLAIAAGADVKVIQTMLGHKDASMTLDIYGHLVPDRLDEVATALDRPSESSRSMPSAPCREGGHVERARYQLNRPGRPQVSAARARRLFDRS
jgi:integrase-like protein